MGVKETETNKQANEFMPLTFHIVYVPGSVSYLLSFVESLLRWSEYSFCLVSNGCPENEQQLMRAYCQRNPRLEFLSLPTNRQLAHQEALNYLQARTSEDTFCFMDSDIFACGPFMDQIDALNCAYAGIFAGAPFWLRPEDQMMSASVNIACGEHNRTHTGLPLGSTFFAVYDNRLLTDFIHRTGIGFEIRDWPQLPSWLRTWCINQGMEGYWFDTGKVLNLGLQQQGYKISVLDSPNLCHLGNLSFIAKRRRYDAQKSQHLFVGGLYYHARELCINLRHRINQDHVFRSARLPFLRRRQRYAPYFYDLLAALVNGKRPPRLPYEDDPTIRQRAQSATEQIADLYYDFAGQCSSWEQAAQTQ
jgi:hypothetical protein